MKVGIFGGSFDPIHSEHVACALAAKEALRLDRVVVVPSFIGPHKRGGASAAGEDRLEMCKLAFRGHDFAEVSDFELALGGTSYSHITCRHFQELYPDAERFLLVGADMLEDFFTWKNPDDIVARTTVAACGRGKLSAAGLHEAFRARFSRDFAEVPFTGKEISSTELRVFLAFGKRPAGLDDAVYTYIRERGLYARPVISEALALEKEARREHSLRVALMACKRSRSLKIPEEQALLAAALHDCAKYVPPESPLLQGFVPPEEVPAPVLHQYTGAYLAEHALGVRDEVVLDAIRYHASGREDMTPLGKLIYLADLLEDARTFEGVEELRALFWKDLDACLVSALSCQLAYLRESGKPVYGLTQKAYEWARDHQK